MTHTYRIPSSHPCLAGHFPGKPIVPGALIVAYVLEAFNNAYPQKTISKVLHVKFSQALNPEEDFNIEFIASSDDSIKFACALTDGKLISRGKLACNIQS